MTKVDHDHAARLVTHLSQQRSSGKYCDVCVCIEDRRFLAHKCVLSANSDQLDALILDATDDENASHNIEIEIQGVSPIGFEIVLEYFYTGVLRIDPMTVKDTWMTAVCLGLPDIMSHCSSYCQSSQMTTLKPSTSTSSSTRTQANLNGNGSNTAGLASPRSISGRNDALSRISKTATQLSATTQPKVSSTTKRKETATGVCNAAQKGASLKPYEVAEGVNDRINANGLPRKRAKLTMEQSSPALKHKSSSGQTGEALPSKSESKDVDRIHGYGAYSSPVRIDGGTWTTNGGNQQQWSMLQLGKGQMVTNVIPGSPQLVNTVPTLVTAGVQNVGGEVTAENNVTEHGDRSGARSPISYTTLSLVSQGLHQSDSRNDGDLEAADTASPVPATPAPLIEDSTVQMLDSSAASSQTVNVDGVQFGHQRKFPAPPSVTSLFVEPVATIGNLRIVNSGGSTASKCETMQMQTEVEQLRIQQQQLQRQLGSGEEGKVVAVIPDATLVNAIALSSANRKRKASARAVKSEDGTMTRCEPRPRDRVRKTKSQADSVPSMITPEHLECLYRKYSNISKEVPVQGLCDAMQLLQHGRARQRKCTEQRALNRTIRNMLDRTGITDSDDTRVEDAVCLIMDRFSVLQDHMNDVNVRKLLTIKVKHSIHCKKWRLKQHRMKQLGKSSTSEPESQASRVPDAIVSSIVEQ